jgi:hypothetical protein
MLEDLDPGASIPDAATGNKQIGTNPSIQASHPPPAPGEALEPLPGNESSKDAAGGGDGAPASERTTPLSRNGFGSTGC